MKRAQVIAEKTSTREEALFHREYVKAKEASEVDHHISVREVCLAKNLEIV